MRNTGENTEPLLARLGSTCVCQCGVGVRTRHSYSALCCSPSALSWWDESEAVETRVPSGPATRLRLKEPVTAMGQGRRQLICMLNVWKWEQIVELGDKYWTGSGPETKPTWGNERLWKANELPEMKQRGRVGERLRTESPGTPYWLWQQADHSCGIVPQATCQGALEVSFEQLSLSSLLRFPFLCTFHSFLALSPNFWPCCTSSTPIPT